MFAVPKALRERQTHLMNTSPLLLVDVGNLVQTTIAHQPTMRKSQSWFFADDRRLDFHDLRHVVGRRLEFVGSDSIVDGNQHLTVNVSTIVDPAQILDEVFTSHSSLGL